MKKRKLIVVLCITLIGILSIIGYLDYQNFIHEKENKNVSEKKSTKKKDTEVKKVKYDNPISELIESYQNEEIVAKLSIPSLELEEGIAKGSDNNFYLNHDLYKNESQLGAVFVDFRIKNLNTAKQINIYGHNSNFYTLPFKALENYMNEEFFRNNSLIYLYTDEQKLTYQVFATKIITTEDEHVIISFGENNTFLNHVNEMRQNALYDTNEAILKTDKILILQTCLYNPEGRKLLVMAKLTSTI